MAILGNSIIEDLAKDMIETADIIDDSIIDAIHRLYTEALVKSFENMSP